VGAVVLKELGKLSVDDYVSIVRSVWRNIHVRRPTLDYVLHVLDHASKLGEAIRQVNAEKILHEIAGTANWLFGLVAKLNDDKPAEESRLNIKVPLSKMIWNKYPMLCPHCFMSPTFRGKRTEEIGEKLRGKCQRCLVDYPKVENRPKDEERRAKAEIRKFAGNTIADAPKTLQQFEKMFHELYVANIAVSSIENIGFHLLEEAGELGRAVIDIFEDQDRHQPELDERQRDLCDEIAEVFGWLCSLTLKVRGQAETFDDFQRGLNILPSAGRGLSESIDLEKILWVLYRDNQSKRYRCLHCHRSTCRCRLTFAWSGGV